MSCSERAWGHLRVRSRPDCKSFRTCSDPVMTPREGGCVQLSPFRSISLSFSGWRADASCLAIHQMIGGGAVAPEEVIYTLSVHPCLNVFNDDLKLPRAEL